ncbi:MAG: hypothetical protein EBZ78_08225, partial [Verrucomicrobia bacterium]|nr:hypothetical protein [Verrucomicrobiota bacterium]
MTRRQEVLDGARRPGGPIATLRAQEPRQAVRQDSEGLFVGQRRQVYGRGRELHRFRQRGRARRGLTAGVELERWRGARLPLPGRLPVDGGHATAQPGRKLFGDTAAKGVRTAEGRRDDGVPLGLVHVLSRSETGREEPPPAYQCIPGGTRV